MRRLRRQRSTNRAPSRTEVTGRVRGRDAGTQHDLGTTRGQPIERIGGEELNPAPCRCHEKNPTKQQKTPKKTGKAASFALRFKHPDQSRAPGRKGQFRLEPEKTFSASFWEVKQAGFRKLPSKGHRGGRGVSAGAEREVSCPSPPSQGIITGQRIAAHPITAPAPLF